MTTTALQTLTARTPEDVIAAVPLVLGFVPEESVVMLTFGGRHTFHARLDLPAAGSATDHPLTVEDLVRVLGDTGTGQTRRALVSIHAADPLPELPELSEMWGTEVDPRDPDQVADAVDRLTDAERQLTEYRRALHARIDEATGELIVRYRADPRAALSIIPQE